MPLTALRVVAYVMRERAVRLDTPVRVAAAVVLVILGWALARDLGRWVGPRCSGAWTRDRRDGLVPDPAVVPGIAALSALRIAGLDPRTLAVGGAITAVVFGLAAQQTLGNLIAGVVLIAARPFRVGDRVRLQAGGWRARSRAWSPRSGCSTTPFARRGHDHGPQQRRAHSAVVPLREPAAVDLRARLRPDVKPSEVQALLQRPRDDADPPRAAHRARGGRLRRGHRAHRRHAGVRRDGPRLADEMLAAIASVTREGDTAERCRPPRSRRRRQPTGIAAAPTAMTAAPTATAPAPTATAPAPTGPAPASCRCSPTAPGAVARGNVTPRRQDVDMVPQGARRWARPWIATASCERCMPTSSARTR